MTDRISRIKFKLTPSSLAAKSALAFAIFVIFSFFSLGTLFWYLWKESDDRILQAGSVEVAIDMAKQLEPLLQGEINPWAVQLLIDKIIAANPNLNPFLLAEDGTPIEIFSRASVSIDPRKKKIELAPVRQYLNDIRRTSFPIYGEIPAVLKDKAVFVAANIRINEQPGFLYIILRSQRLHAMWMFFSLENMIRGSAIYGTAYAIIAWLLAASVFLLLSRRLIRTMGVVEKIAVGDFSQRVAVSGADELDRLGIAVNVMADTIVKNIEELSRKDRLRRELIANVSHDLRGPITLISGYTERLLISNYDEQKMRDIAGVILKNSQALTRLLFELFELAKFEARDVVPKMEPFSITEMVEDLRHRYCVAAEELRNITVSSVADKNTPLVLGEPAMIERVLANLIENALTYTLDNGKIDLRVVNLESKVRVEIADTGVGISAEDLPHVFDKFFRVEKWQDRRSSSGGLGLAIVKKIIEAHNSQITISSVEGQGTTFSFELEKC